MKPRSKLLACALLALLLGALGTAQADVPRIGVEDDWYPYSAVRQGEIRGLSVDIVRAAFAAAGVEVELLAYPYARCMQMTRKGELAGCFNTAPNPQIARDYLLPEQPLFQDDILLWARQGEYSEIQHLQQLDGRRVAVTIGYEYGSRFDSREAIQRVPVRQDLNGFRMLQRGRVAFFVAYRGTAAVLFSEHPELAGQFHALATVHRPSLYLSFSRQHAQAPALLAAFDRGMRALHSSGRYQAILRDWAPTAAHAQPALLKLGGP